jgi:LmbE family N-acetylglucosaminyl deacetylase
MTPLRLERLRTLLCLGAHADDVEIGCGATVLRFLREYGPCDVHWVVFASDERRAVEARASAALWLAEAREKHIRVFSFRDSFFPYDGPAIKQAFQELSRTISPDLILTHRREDLHQDHRVIAELTWNAFRNHLIWEYEIPKYDGDLGRPNVYVPLSPADCQRKADMLMANFPSQSSKPWFTRDTFLSLMRIRGVECHAQSGFAEAYFAHKTVL